MPRLYSCIAQDKDHTEKETRLDQTRCVDFSNRVHGRSCNAINDAYTQSSFESVSYGQRLRIVERTIIDDR